MHWNQEFNDKRSIIIVIYGWDNCLSTLICKPAWGTASNHNPDFGCIFLNRDFGIWLSHKPLNSWFKRLSLLPTDACYIEDNFNQEINFPIIVSSRNVQNRFSCSMIHVEMNIINWPIFCPVFHHFKFTQFSVVPFQQQKRISAAKTRTCARQEPFRQSLRCDVWRRGRHFTRWMAGRRRISSQPPPSPSGLPVN